MDEKRIAVLIDADNISSSYIVHILNELAKYGTPTYKRIYGDWTSTHNSAWKNVLLAHSITPIQQYSYTTGKNATDSALIIDAMDILYTGNVDSFCIVSSDSDFTRLAARLREAGMYVIGMGEKKTPAAFVSSCEAFKFLEVISAQEPAVPKATAFNFDDDDTAEPKETMASYDEIKTAMQKIVEDAEQDDGWTFLSDVGNVLSKRYPDFDTRNYGHSKLINLMRSMKVFDVELRGVEGTNAKQACVRNKK